MLKMEIRQKDILFRNTFLVWPYKPGYCFTRRFR